MYKSQLQEYAQKASLPSPVYEIFKEGPSHDPRFKATVVVEGQTYESPGFFGNLKKAEHAAAGVALAALAGKPDSQALPGPLHESGLCKNLLQEYAQKCKLPLPIYTLERSGEGHLPVFSATVEIAGVRYKGGVCRNKKEAEIKAAKTALLAIFADPAISFSFQSLGNLSSPAAVSPPTSNFQLTQITKKKNKGDGSNDVSNEINNCSSTKKKRMTAKRFRKKIKMNDGSSVKVEHIDKNTNNGGDSSSNGNRQNSLELNNSLRLSADAADIPGITMKTPQKDRENHKGSNSKRGEVFAQSSAAQLS